MKVIKVIHRGIWQLIVMLVALSLSLPMAQAKTVERRGPTGGWYGGTSAGAPKGGYIDTCLIVGRSGKGVHATSFDTYVYCIDVEDPKRTIYAFQDSNFNTKEASIAAMRKPKYKDGDIWTIYFPYKLTAAEGSSSEELDEPDRPGWYSPDRIDVSTYLSTLKQYEAKLGTKLTKPVTLADVMTGNLGKTEQQILEESEPPSRTSPLPKGASVSRWINQGVNKGRKHYCWVDVFFNAQKKMVTWRSNCKNEHITLPQKDIPIDTPFRFAPNLPNEIYQEYKKYH